MLRNLISTLIVLAIFCPASHANWLVIDPNGSVASWDTQPSSGQVCPGAQILLLPDGFNPNQLSNYQADPNNPGNAIYVAPPIPPSPPPPSPTPASMLPTFIQAVRTDPNLTAANRMELSTMLALISMDINNPTALQQDWNDAVSTYNSTWLTPSVQNIILNYAAANNIPLI